MSGPVNSASPQRCSFPETQAETAQSPGAGSWKGAFQPQPQTGHPLESHRAQVLHPQPESPLLPSACQDRCWRSPSRLGQWASGRTSSEGRGTASWAFFSFCLPAQPSPISALSPVSFQPPNPDESGFPQHQLLRRAEQRSERGWPFPSFLFQFSGLAWCLCYLRR